VRRWTPVEGVGNGARRSAALGLGLVSLDNLEGARLNPITEKTDLVPYVDHEEVARFLRRVASYGADDWRGFVSAARARGVLDTPVYLPLVRNPGERRGSEEAVADPRRLAAVADARSHTAAILGESLTWSELTPGKIQYLVCVLARSSVDGRGARTAEYMCDMLYITANWLRQEELIPESAALPKRN
jgi:hypothetical protein